MRLPCLTKPPHGLTRAGLHRLGGAQSLGSAIRGRVAGSEADRYTVKRAEPCAACTRGQHSKCTSIHCPCERCNKGAL